jgi:hypothetical protein
MKPPDFDDLPRAYRIGLRLRELGADDDLIGECLGMDPAGVSTLIEIGRRKATSEPPGAPQVGPPNSDADPPYLGSVTATEGFGNSVRTTEALPQGQFVPSERSSPEVRQRGATVTNLSMPTVQGLLDAAEAGDYGPVFDSFAENIIVENGPGAGPWRHATGRDEFANVLLGFSGFFNDTFHQHGRCIYADDRVVISLIEESGSTAAGDVFENLAVYVTRVGADGKADRLWTVDLDAEACLEFWARNPVSSAGDSEGGSVERANETVR